MGKKSSSAVKHEEGKEGPSPISATAEAHALLRLLEEAGRMKKGGVAKRGEEERGGANREGKEGEKKGGKEEEEEYEVSTSEVGKKISAAFISDAPLPSSSSSTSAASGESPARSSTKADFDRAAANAEETRRRIRVVRPPVDPSPLEYDDVEEEVVAVEEEDGTLSIPSSSLSLPPSRPPLLMSSTTGGSSEGGERGDEVDKREERGKSREGGEGGGEKSKAEFLADASQGGSNKGREGGEGGREVGKEKENKEERREEEGQASFPFSPLPPLTDADHALTSPTAGEGVAGVREKVEKVIDCNGNRVFDPSYVECEVREEGEKRDEVEVTEKREKKGGEERGNEEGGVSESGKEDGHSSSDEKKEEEKEEIEETVVEAFALDPDFDYDNVDLTPRFHPGELPPFLEKQYFGGAGQPMADNRRQNTEEKGGGEGEKKGGLVFLN
uniref:Uncharacterized protein n=1 Tax=Palpitomonas bilix TaxID=652834 RepID=A0A7S3CVZ0_9EUKA